MIRAEKLQEQQKPIDWNPKNPMPLQYERIKLQGRYLPQIFLLDNQHYHHQFGYDVLSPMELSESSVVMIDRGWIPGDKARLGLSQIQLPQGLVRLQGRVYFPSKNRWILGPVVEKKANELLILERMDEQLISQFLQKEVHPFIIRLDKADKYGFVREWETVSMTPQRHFAYAFQWFVMALAVLILFVALNLKKKHEEKSH